MQLGSVSTLGFVISRHLYQEGPKAVTREQLVLEDMEVEESKDSKNSNRKLLSHGVEKIGLYCFRKVHVWIRIH